MSFLATCLSFLLMITAIFSGDKPAYRLFDKKGMNTDYSELLNEAAKADVVFFGEAHNDPIAHWLQREIAEDLYKTHKDKLVIGAEMFEADGQLLLNEYIAGQISETSFENEARLWPNYKTDYKPVVTFAKENRIPIIATNVPRRYASMVAGGGLAVLEKTAPEARIFIAPLPIATDMELPGYKKMMSMFGSGHGTSKSENIVHAQMLKDATMAHFIAENLKNGKKLLHLNGSYHSDNFEGIVWYLKQKYPGLKIVTISTVSQENLEKLEKDYVGRADFVIAVPVTMTKTH